MKSDIGPGVGRGVPAEPRSKLRSAPARRDASPYRHTIRCAGIIAMLCRIFDLSAQTPAPPELLLPGGIVVPLYPPGSPHLKADRVAEAEKITRSGGRVQNIVNIHNPSIEVHAVGGNRNTGTVVIVAP